MGIKVDINIINNNLQTVHLKLLQRSDITDGVSGKFSLNFLRSFVIHVNMHHFFTTVLHQKCKLNVTHF